MFNQSTWKCKGSDDLFSLKSTANSDEYFLEYSIDNESIIETIGIFISNEKHALLVYSNKFGRTDISILDKDNIVINNKQYQRIPKLL